MQSTVLHAAKRHAELIASLATLDHASSELQQTKAYIGDLENDLKETESKIKSLESKTGVERKEHESLRDSVTRRLTYKLTGRRERFEEKAKKEEREYVDALQEEMSMRNRRETCQQMLQEALLTQSRLGFELTKHDTVKQQLDVLYESIFSGPTPEHPEEDQVEKLVDDALAAFNDINSQLQVELRAKQLISSAQQSLQSALTLTKDALNASEMDMRGFGGSFADYMERSALAQAQTRVSATQMHIRQAQQVQPLIQPIPPIVLPQGNLWSDLVFDNYYADLAFHRKIEAAHIQIVRALTQLKSQEAKANERLQPLQRQLRDVKEQLSAARKELQVVRQLAFERTLDNAQNPPPGYDEHDPPPEFPTD